MEQKRCLLSFTKKEIRLIFDGLSCIESYALTGEEAQPAKDLAWNILCYLGKHYKEWKTEMNEEEDLRKWRKAGGKS